VLDFLVVVVVEAVVGGLLVLFVEHVLLQLLVVELVGLSVR
jgi:hypothetical protein